MGAPEDVIHELEGHEPEHPRPDFPHHLPYPLAFGCPVTMDAAGRTERLGLPEGAAVELLMGIGEESSAVGAELSSLAGTPSASPMFEAAESPDHDAHCALLPFDAPCTAPSARDCPIRILVR